METKGNKLTSMILLVLMVVSVGIGLLYYGNVITENIFIIWGYVLLGIGLAFAIFAPIISFIRNPKSARNTLLGILVFVVLFGITYFLASNSIQGEVYDKYEVSQSSSKLIGAGLLGTYVLAGLAILLALVSGTGIFKIFK